MSTRFWIWSAFLISSLVASGLCMRAMALQGVPSHQSLIGRGVVCLLLAILYGIGRGYPLRPKAPRTQLIRALIAGLALSFYTLSYDWISASAVSVLSNIDVPLLVVLGPWIGVQATRKARALAFASIGFLVLYVLSLEQHGSGLYLGIGLVGLGSLFLCFGYLFIKKSMEEENEAITIIVPALAILCYGATQGALPSGGNAVSWDFQTAVQAVLAGAGMFGAYIATMRLYQLTDLASAEFPTLISSIVIQPLETWWLGERLHWSYLASSIAFVLLIYFVIHGSPRSASGEEPAHA